jgi:hypothetical protein
MSGKITLTIVTGPKAGTTFIFEEHDILLLGREKDCQVCLPEDPQISRHHFILEVNPPQIRIRDLGSLHGTYINGQKYGGRGKYETPAEGAGRTSAQIDLHDGDEIRAGKTTFQVRVETARIHKSRRCLKCYERISIEDGEGGQDDNICKICRQEQVRDSSQMHYLPFFHEQSQSLGQKGIDVPDYKIIQELGQGGMGIVYLAQHIKDGRQVALKVMHSRGSGDERSHKKFLREMEATRALRHPHIITFLESGVRHDIFYFLLEFCEGGNVADLIVRRHGRLTLEEAKPIILQTLQGLAFAHKQRFVHRDIKPQNILLRGKEGSWSARLADLGLAKNFEQAGFSGLTFTGEKVGTFQFMPREQVTHFKGFKPVSDVWAMGATCYYMLTGAFPRNHLDTQDQVAVILRGEIIPIGTRDPSIPRPIAEVIDRSLADKVNDRYQHAGEMYEALKKVLSTVIS